MEMVLVDLMYILDDNLLRTNVSLQLKRSIQQQMEPQWKKIVLAPADVMQNLE